jgi:hypothetical protein
MICQCGGTEVAATYCGDTEGPRLLRDGRRLSIDEFAAILLAVKGASPYLRDNVLVESSPVRLERLILSNA